MINQVLLAGRLAGDPRILEGAGGPCVEMEVEVERVPHFDSEKTERAPVTVRAFGDRIVGIVTKYFHRGQGVLVHGHLRGGESGLLVVMDRFEFVNSGVVARALQDLGKRRAVSVA